MTTMTKTKQQPIYRTRTIKERHVIYSDIGYFFPSVNLKLISSEKADLPEIIYLNHNQMTNGLVNALLDLGFEKVHEFTNQKTSNQITVFKRE